MRRFLGTLTLLFAVLAMHGGLGASCQDAAMATTAHASHDVGMSMEDSPLIALHHLPVPPPEPQSGNKMTSCKFIVPRAELTAPNLQKLSVAVVTTTFVHSHVSRQRPSGREPARPRYLDPIAGLGVLRT